METPKTGVELIAEERQEQIKKHGHTAEKDDLKVDEELVGVARYILFANNDYLPKGYDRDDIMQIFTRPRIEQLAIAGAMLAAEIDRLQRLENGN